MLREQISRIAVVSEPVGEVRADVVMTESLASTMQALAEREARINVQEMEKARIQASLHSDIQQQQPSASR